MSVNDWLITSTKELQEAGIATARLDCLVLLEDALGVDRASILANLDAKLPQKTEVDLNTKIVQRVRHIPLAYIRGKVEFYGREFVINKHVLVPRPETEMMIDELKAALQKGAPHTECVIVDVGTGSGAIAVTAKLEFPKAHVIATDIDPKVLKIARQNAKKHDVNIEFTQGDLLAPLPAAKPPTVILANLPYVPDRYSINQAAEHEPKHAIFGGKDGLNLYRRFWEQIARLCRKPFLVLTESLPMQHNGMLDLARQANFELRSSQNFIQVFGPTVN